MRPKFIRDTSKNKEIRRLLDRHFPLGSDFEAFCLDNFPHIHSKFSSTMDRTHQVNILLQCCDAKVLQDKLRQDFQHEANHAWIRSLSRRIISYIVSVILSVGFFTFLYTRFQYNGANAPLSLTAPSLGTIPDLSSIISREPVYADKAEESPPPTYNRSVPGERKKKKLGAEVKYACQIKNPILDEPVGRSVKSCASVLAESLANAKATSPKVEISLHKANSYVISITSPHDGTVSNAIYRSEFPLCVASLARMQNSPEKISFQCCPDN